MSNSSIHKRLKFIREEILHCSQKEMGSILGIPQTTLSRYESGTHEFGKPVALALEHMYGINHRWMMEGEGEMLVKRPALKALPPSIQLNEASTGGSDAHSWKEKEDLYKQLLASHQEQIEALKELLRAKDVIIAGLKSAHPKQ